MWVQVFIPTTRSRSVTFVLLRLDSVQIVSSGFLNSSDGQKDTWSSQRGALCAEPGGQSDGAGETAL